MLEALVSIFIGVWLARTGWRVIKHLTHQKQANNALAVKENAPRSILDSMHYQLGRLEERSRVADEAIAKLEAQKIHLVESPSSMHTELSHAVINDTIVAMDLAKARVTEYFIKQGMSESRAEDVANEFFTLDLERQDDAA